VPKSLHGPIINDGWFSRGAAWNAAEDIVVYVAEQRPSEQTPAFGSNGKAAGSSGGNSGSNGGSSGGKAAAPRTWKGVAAAVEDWGELNTGQSRGVGGATLTPRHSGVCGRCMSHKFVLLLLLPLLPPPPPGKQPPSLYALNTTTWQVHQIEGLSAVDASWGQPVWTPDGQGLVAVAWLHKHLNFPG
jgi:hypothetical protein